MKQKHITGKVVLVLIDSHRYEWMTWLTSGGKWIWKYLFGELARVLSKQTQLTFFYVILWECSMLQFMWFLCRYINSSPRVVRVAKQFNTRTVGFILSEVSIFIAAGQRKKNLPEHESVVGESLDVMNTCVTRNTKVGDRWKFTLVTSGLRSCI